MMAVGAAARLAAGVGEEMAAVEAMQKAAEAEEVEGRQAMAEAMVRKGKKARE